MGVYVIVTPAASKPFTSKIIVDGVLCDRRYFKSGAVFLTELFQCDQN
jgi:hypothetical protein